MVWLRRRGGRSGGRGETETFIEKVRRELGLESDCGLGEAGGGGAGVGFGRRNKSNIDLYVSSFDCAAGGIALIGVKGRRLSLKGEEEAEEG